MKASVQCAGIGNRIALNLVLPYLRRSIDVHIFVARLRNMVVFHENFKTSQVLRSLRRNQNVRVPKNGCTGKKILPL